MDYIIMAAVTIIGGAVIGWTAASNTGGLMDRPMIFHKIDPLYFIFTGLVLTAFVGYMLYGVMGIVTGLVGAWVVSGIVGNMIRRR